MYGFPLRWMATCFCFLPLVFEAEKLQRLSMSNVRVPCESPGTRIDAAVSKSASLRKQVAWKLNGLRPSGSLPWYYPVTPLHLEVSCVSSWGQFPVPRFGSILAPSSRGFSEPSSYWGIPRHWTPLEVTIKSELSDLAETQVMSRVHSLVGVSTKIRHVSTIRTKIYRSILVPNFGPTPQWLEFTCLFETLRGRGVWE